METGPFHLQFFMSVTLIVTAAVVAFICDVLKRNNDQLREMNIELRLRHQTEQKIKAVPAPKPVAHMALPKEKKRGINREALAVMERGAALARPVAMKKDWGTLIDRNAQHAKPATLPVGFVDGPIFSKLVQSRQPISGLVVSIGVDGKLPIDVRELVGSLIGPNDFAAQSGKDELLLIYPQEHSASAQRRLSQVARQLWDFQLRSVGTVEILFSWGGVEVHSEPIEEALASASDRMQETKRGRKLLAPV